MPLTFIDIEKQKTWRIGIFFMILLFMYFCVTLALVQGILFVIFPFHFLKTGSLLLLEKPLSLFAIFGFSLIIAAMHFWFSASDAVKSVMDNLGAADPDPDDGIHSRLINIIDEMHIVTGTTRKIQCMVIPTLSMNALAVADLNGNSAIAITEGLLSRLTRSQTEAVLAHEAYHILSGDCMEATVATSLFGMYAAMIEKLQDFGDEDRRGIYPAFLVFWFLLKLSQLLNMFIFREREYRADAASVRMTRDPLSMAEALQLISRNWRGSGLIASGLEMLCIINPQEAELDESEGFWANLMSTHPPIQKRIEILLRMAHINRKDLEKKMQLKKESIVIPNSHEPAYYILDPSHQWQGPYKIIELSMLPWLSSMSWVKISQEEPAMRASEDPFIHAILKEHLNRIDKEFSDLKCPLCRQSLFEIPYEKTRVYRCHYCGGTLVENIKIPRIIVRKEKECTERIKSLAIAVTIDNQRKLSLKKLKGAAMGNRCLTACPMCQHSMLRTFYSLAYLIEIDRCNICNITWFDPDELEMLQCLIENKLTARFDM
jgi:heat shock protein HtpX